LQQIIEISFHHLWPNRKQIKGNLKLMSCQKFIQSKNNLILRLVL